MGLVPGVDDGTAPGRRRRHALPDVLGPLADAVHGPARRLQDLARAGVDLTGHEERDEHLGVVPEVVPPAGQVVLVAPVGVAGRVGVVLKQEDDAPYAFPSHAGPGRYHQVFEDALPRLVVHHQVLDGVAFRGGVFGMAAHIQVQPGTVLEEDVGRAAPAHHPPEKVAGDLVGTEPALAAESAGHPVLVLEAEDATVHEGHATVTGDVL